MWYSVLPVVLLAAIFTSGQTPPRTVAEAEADGAVHPKSSEGSEAAIYGHAFGPTERQCVDAEKHATARSGEFVAGPFDEYVMMAGSRQRKVWWTPRQTAVIPPMQLRATKVAAPALAVNWTFPSVVRNDNGYFFNTTFRFPEAGKWLAVVTSGNNWGCFILEEP